MDQRQDIAISGDFLFRAVARLSLVDDEPTDAIRRNVHTFQTRRGFAGFDLRDLQQPRQNFRGLSVEEFLPTPEFANGPQRGSLLGIKPEPGQELRGQGMHARLWVAGNGVIIPLNRVNFIRQPYF